MYSIVQGYHTGRVPSNGGQQGVSCKVVQWGAGSAAGEVRWMVVEWGVLGGRSGSVELGAVGSGYWCGPRGVMWMMVEWGVLVGRIGSVELGDGVCMSWWDWVGGSGNVGGDGDECHVDGESVWCAGGQY